MHHTICHGTKRNDARISGLQGSLNHNPPRNGKEQQEMFITYVISNESALAKAI